MVRNIFRVGLVALVSLFVASCATTPTSQSNMSGGVVDVSYEAVGLVNYFRAQNGLGPVSVDSAVVEAARYQAVAMASRDVLSHEVAGDFTTRMNNAGFTYALATENVGAADRSVADSINAWIRSPHHRENMLMREAKYMGMIRASAPGSRYRTYWALILTSAQAGSGPKIIYSSAKPSRGKVGTPFENDGVQIFFTGQ
ncbi:MAG: CAP domain-containing protein [Hyphomicrobiales bacterium]|nr:CAP domain-containing protein [Hyphomicrobiales bacterium]